MSGVKKFDDSTPIGDLKTMVNDFIKERDWRKYHTTRNISESIIIEAAELLELFQWSGNSDQDPKTERITEELSDIIIYCLSLAIAEDIDITSSVKAKIEKNKKKYPVDLVKGKYIKYNKLDTQ